MIKKRKTPTRKVHEKVAEQIRILIEKKGLKEGEQLPSERDLSQSLKVSRHSVREAIRKLEQQDILQTRTGSGTYIYKNIQHEFVMNSLAGVVIQQENKIQDIIEFRMMIEPQIASLASQNATEGDLLYLEEILHRQNNAKDSIESTSWDSEYHLGLARATGNMVLLNLILKMNDIIYIYRESIYQSTERSNRSYFGHLKILEAIRSGNPERSAETMREHLKEIGEEILNKS